MSEYRWSEVWTNEFPNILMSTNDHLISEALQLHPLHETNDSESLIKTSIIRNENQSASEGVHSISWFITWIFRIPLLQHIPFVLLTGGTESSIRNGVIWSSVHEMNGSRTFAWHLFMDLYDSYLVSSRMESLFAASESRSSSPRFRFMIACISG